MQKFLSFFKKHNPQKAEEKASRVSPRSELIQKLNTIEYKTDERGEMHFSCEDDKDEYQELQTKIQSLPK